MHVPAGWAGGFGRIAMWGVLSLSVALAACSRRPALPWTVSAIRGSVPATRSATRCRASRPWPGSNRRPSWVARLSYLIAWCIRRPIAARDEPKIEHMASKFFPLAM